MKISLKISGRERLDLEVELGSDGRIQKSSLTGIGDRKFLKVLHEYRKNLQGPLKDLPLPSGHSPAEMMISEAVLKLRGDWHPVYTEEELCHCRGIPFQVVDNAVIAGAHTPEKVSAWTSASTACGTCRPDVEAHLRFRLRSGN